MTDGGDPAIAQAEITFPARRRASVVFARRDAAPADVVRALDLPAPRGVLVLNGGTAGFSPEVEARLAPLLADGLARVASEERLTTITGGTHAGVFALFGAGLEDRAPGVCIGVAPAELVTWPGRSSAADDAAPLEPHHSHFVLVDGHEWGDELPTMMRLAALLAAQAPSLAVIAGGGDGTRGELVAHTQAGRDVVVIGGSGGLADEVAAAAAGRASGDLEVVEAVGSGRVTVLGLEAGAGQLGELVRSRLGRRRRKKFNPPALLGRFPLVPYRLPPDYPFVSEEQRAAAPLLETEMTRLDRELVPRFRRLDHDALVAQHRFRLGSVLLIVGSAVAAALGAVQAALGGGVLGIGIAEAVVGAVVAGVVVYMRGRRFQQTYLTKRLQAERLKSQYYLYLTRAGSYAVPDDAARAKLLAHTLDRIETGGEPG
jgi:hypothetical protein